MVVAGEIIWGERRRHVARVGSKTERREEGGKNGTKEGRGKGGTKEEKKGGNEGRKEF